MSDEKSLTADVPRPKNQTEPGKRAFWDLLLRLESKMAVREANDIEIAVILRQLKSMMNLDVESEPLPDE